MMPGIEKAPTLAITGRRTGAGAKKEAEEKTTRFFTGWEGLAAVKRGGLTHARPWGMVEAPNFVRRHKRLSRPLPMTGKSLVAHSACLAAGVAIGRLVHIGEKLRPGFSDGPAASRRPGSVVSRLFFLIPKTS